MGKIYITYSRHRVVDGFDNNETLKVMNNKDYLESRLCINKFKAGLYQGDLNIVVVNSKFKSGYEDLKFIGDFVEFTEFSMKRLIKEKLSIKIPQYISEFDLVEVFNSTDKLNQFMDKYNYDYSFEENLATNIMEIDNLNFIDGLESIVGFLSDKFELLSSIDNTDLPKDTVINVINNRSDQFDLKNDFIEAMGESNGFSSLLKKIVSSIVLRDYKDTDRKILGYGSTYPKESILDISDEFMMNILNKNRNLIEDIDNKMRNENEKIALYSSSVELEYFVENSSGFMNFELDFFISKFKNELYDINREERLKYLYAILDKVKKKFSFILESDKELEEELNLLSDITNRLGQIEVYKDSFYDIEEWWSFYKEDYVKNFNSLSSNNDIYKLISKADLDVKLESKIINLVKEKEKNLNNNYEKFLIENYKDFISTTNNKTVSGKLHSLRDIHRDKKIIFIVIDAMRWSIWEVIRKIFEKYNYETVNQNNVTLSMLPSVTSVSRLSLFAGNNYKNLVNQKLEKDYSYSIKDEEKHMKRYFDDKEVAFKSGGKQNFKELMQEDADIYSFVFTDVDNLFHGLLDISEDIVSSIFESQVKNFVEEIEGKFSEDQYNIVLATDHGSTDITNQYPVKPDKNLEIYLDDNKMKHSRHGKYYRIYTDQDVDKKTYQNLLDYFEKDEQKDCWYVIKQEDMQNFALPIEDTDGTNLLWVINKYPYYISQRSGSNIHGGLTMDETIIPFAIMEKNKSGVKELEISIKSDLEVDETSDINITIKNTNNLNIEDLSIESKEINLSSKNNSVSSKSEKKISYSIKLNTSGTISSNFIFRYLVKGEERIQKISKDIIVKETSKEKISKKVNKSRSLDF